MFMLRKSIPVFKVGIVVTAIGAGLYFYNKDYGKFVTGAGLVILSVAMALYVFFMFRRYGDKSRN